MSAEANAEDILDTSTTAAAVTHHNAAVAEDDDDAVEFGDEDLMKDDQLPKLIPAKGDWIRVNLLTDLLGMVRGWSHFIPNKGSYRCLSERDKKTGRIIGQEAICCTKAEAIKDEKIRKGAIAKLIIAALAVQYTNASKTDGAYKKTASGTIPAIEFRIGWLKLSRYAYREVTLMINGEESEKVTDFDVLVGPDPKGGIGFAYKRLMSKFGSRLRMEQEAATFARVKEEAAIYLDGKDLKAKLGKKVSAVEMAALWAGQAAASASEASVDNADEII
jgi:hypothetical protein